jgi:hypothetical protein
VQLRCIVATAAAVRAQKISAAAVSIVFGFVLSTEAQRSCGAIQRSCGAIQRSCGETLRITVLSF